MGDYRETYYIARVKKPHRKFAVGDILIGDQRDGEARQLLCWGWSSKLRVFIRAYYMRYQGWDDWWRDDERYNRTTGNGHITIVGEFEASSIELLDEVSVKSYTDFIRQLSLFGGNVLEQVEAAATHPHDRRNP